MNQRQTNPFIPLNQVYDSGSSTFIHTEKTYGKSLKPHDLPQAFARVFPNSSETSTQGVPPHLLQRLLDAMTDEVEWMEAVLEDVEMVMIGGSLLVIWEGDAATLERALDAAEQLTEAMNRETEGDGSGVHGDADDEEADEEEESSSDSDSNDARKPKKLGPPFLLKLIDFAHSRLTPGGGNDQGVLRGLRTIADLLHKRADEVNRL
jgi:1D-myo-inositol-tetrakisphosphate 5-kinase/inositol-polyphosphate multikinase